MLPTSRPPITDKKSHVLIPAHEFLSPNQHHFLNPFHLIRILETCYILESKVNQFDIVNNFQYSFDMIFGLVPVLACPGVTIRAIVCGMDTSDPPRLLNIGPLSTAHCPTHHPPPPPFFPIVQRQQCVRHTSCSLSGHTQ